MSPVGQVNNSQLRGLLDSDFQRSSDPSFLQRIMVSKYLHLPGLRGFWGVGYRNDTAYAGNPYATDGSGNGYHMPPVDGNPVLHSVPGVSYFEFAAAPYFALADNAHFDILGNEAWIASPGLALGAWIRTARARPYAGDEGIITKYSAAVNNYGYALELEQANANRLSLALSSTGANQYYFDHTKTILVDTWYFVAATYNPGAVGAEAAGVRLWVNENVEYHAASDRGTAGLPATIFNSNQDLQFASRGGAANLWSGFQGYYWICGNYVQQLDIFNLFETTKTVFGYLNEKGTSW